MLDLLLNTCQGFLYSDLTMGAFAEERTAGAGLELERFACQTQDHLNTEKSPPSSSLSGHSKSGQSS